MDSLFTAWLPDSPFRSPGWRWQRANWLHQHNRHSDPRIDDAWVIRARRYLASTGTDDQALMAPSGCAFDPAVHGTVNLVRQDQPNRRWLIEALLLTGDPLEEIADRCELAVEIIEAYHELHFDVRPHLSATDWIMLRAIGCGPWNEYGGDQPGGLWKYAAYTGGVRLLEFVIALTLDLPLPEWIRAQAGKDSAYREARLGFLGKVTLGLMTARSTAETDRLIAAREQMRCLDREFAGKKRGPSGMTQLLERFNRRMNSKKRSSSPRDATAVPGSALELPYRKDMQALRETRSSARSDN